MSSSVETIEFTDFIKKKMEIWFDLNDMKKKGSLGRNDYAHMAELFIQQCNPTQEKKNELKHWLMDGWDILIDEGQDLAAAGKPGGLTAQNAPAVMELKKTLRQGGQISKEQYVNAYGEIIQVNAGLFRENFEKMVSTFFDVFDSDNDGLVSLDELVCGLKCFGLTNPEAVKLIFHDLDVNNIGKIERHNYIKEWVEFMIGSDPNGIMYRYLGNAA